MFSSCISKGDYLPDTADVADNQITVRDAGPAGF
jgi:hypothetical protein